MLAPVQVGCIRQQGRESRCGLFATKDLPAGFKLGLLHPGGFDFRTLVLPFRTGQLIALRSVGTDPNAKRSASTSDFHEDSSSSTKIDSRLEVKWKGAHKLFYIVAPAADSESLSPTSAVTDSASLEQKLSFLDSWNLSCTEPREPEPLLSQPTSSLFDVAVKNELLDSWNRSQTGTGKSIARYQPRQTEPRAPELSTSQQRSIKPNSSAKINLLDSWNSNTGFGEHISGWFVRFMGPGPDTKTRATFAIASSSNGINQSTAAADRGALDDLSYPDIESDCDIGSQSDSEMHFSGKRTAMELDRSDGPGQFSWLCNYLSGSLNSSSSSTVVPGVANLDENDQCSSDARVHSSSQPLYLAMRLQVSIKAKPRRTNRPYKMVKRKPAPPKQQRPRAFERLLGKTYACLEADVKSYCCQKWQCNLVINVSDVITERASSCALSMEELKSSVAAKLEMMLSSTSKWQYIYKAESVCKLMWMRIHGVGSKVMKAAKRLVRNGKKKDSPHLSQKT
eukprot:g72674.t1